MNWIYYNLFIYSFDMYEFIIRVCYNPNYKCQKDFTFLHYFMLINQRFFW